MTMKTIFLLLAGAVILSAQTDTVRSLEAEILATEETDSELLAKSRRSLIAAMHKNDLNKAKEIYRFIIDRFDKSRVIPMWEGEMLLVNYGIGGYDTVLSTIRTDDAERSTVRRIRPPDDLFYDDIKTLLSSRLPELQRLIRTSGKKEDEQEVLLLLLDFLLLPSSADDETTAKHRTEMNRKADEFLRFHSRSEFVPFVRKNIRFVIVPSDFGFGYSFGLGQSIPEGTAATLFGDAFAIAMEFDMTYRRTAAFLHLGIGVGSEVSRGFVNGSEVWTKGLPVNITAVDLTAGYILYHHEGLRIIPNAGIGVIEYSPPEMERNIPGNDVSLTTGTFVAGLHIDIPVSSAEFFAPGVEQYSFLMARVSFSHSFSWESDPIKKGGLSQLTISFGAFGHPMERDL